MKKNSLTIGLLVLSFILFIYSLDTYSQRLTFVPSVINAMGLPSEPKTFDMYLSLKMLHLS